MWLDATGAPMSDARWSDPANHFVALLLAGDRADEPDDDVLLVLNAEDAEHAFVVPGAAGTRHFELRLDTALPDGVPADGAGVDAGAIAHRRAAHRARGRGAAGERVSEHAIEIDRYGGPEELVWREVQRPPPAPEEIRIRTLYAAVNRADLEIRRGEWPIVRDDPFPYTPGLEVVGVVDSVGDRVTGVWPGAHVITMMQHLGGIWGERPGGYGEFVVVPADTVATFAPEIDAEQMAALGLVAVTAAEGLARLDLRAGRARRRARRERRRRLGRCRAGRRARLRGDRRPAARRQGDYVRALGAARVVCLDESGLLDALGARSVDAVLETTGRRTFADSTAVLRRGGRLCLVGALTGAELELSAWDLIQELVLTGWSSENLTADALREHVALIAELVRGGRLPLPAIHRFALRRRRRRPTRRSRPARSPVVRCCAARPEAPLGLEHGEDVEVRVAAGEALGLAQHALVDEAQPLGDGPAAHVVHGCLHLDAVHPPRLEGVIDGRAHGEGHRAAALGAGRQPVADARRQVDAVDVVKADDADDLPGVGDRAVHAVLARGLLLGLREERGGLILVELLGPRHPRREVVAVGQLQRVELVEVAGGQLAHGALGVEREVQRLAHRECASSGANARLASAEPARARVQKAVRAVVEQLARGLRDSVDRRHRQGPAGRDPRHAGARPARAPAGRRGR